MNLWVFRVRFSFSNEYVLLLKHTVDITMTAIILDMAYKKGTNQKFNSTRCFNFIHPRVLTLRTSRPKITNLCLEFAPYTVEKTSLF